MLFVCTAKTVLMKILMCFNIINIYIILYYIHKNRVYVASLKKFKVQD